MSFKIIVRNYKKMGKDADHIILISGHPESFATMHSISIIEQKATNSRIN
ncbi:hypothetical protein [Salegentibacter mishustinae]|jgi:hypothetical protein|nr:hypothetical protein [Salegentibacter mishustinae]PZX63879.1 hypothetical protein LY54_01735 [Salegentibacter mishustinae]